MSTTTSSTIAAHSLPSTVAQNLKSEGRDEQLARKASASLQSIENQLLEELSKPDDAKNQNKIQALQIKYQRALRFYEVLSTMMKNAHDVLMSVIRNLRLN